jgi:hypothetical protein
MTPEEAESARKGEEDLEPSSQRWFASYTAADIEGFRALANRAQEKNP